MNRLDIYFLADNVQNLKFVRIDKSPIESLRNLMIDVHPDLNRPEMSILCATRVEKSSKLTHKYDNQIHRRTKQQFKK